MIGEIPPTSPSKYRLGRRAAVVVGAGWVVGGGWVVGAAVVVTPGGWGDVLGGAEIVVEGAA